MTTRLLSAVLALIIGLLAGSREVGAEADYYQGRTGSSTSGTCSTLGGVLSGTCLSALFSNGTTVGPPSQGFTGVNNGTNTLTLGGALTTTGVNKFPAIGVGVAISGIYPLNVLSISGNGGLKVQSNSSTAVSGDTENVQLFGVHDQTGFGSNYWGLYNQVSVVVGAATGKQTFGEESSMANNNVAVTSDPFNYNISTGVINHRLDCGIGAAGPTNCDHALDIINNGAAYGSGIIFGSTALNAGTLAHPPALSLPSGANGYSISFYKATGYSTPSWQLYSTNTSNNGNKLILGDTNISWADGTNTYFSASTASLRSERSGSGALIAGQRLDSVSSGTAAQFQGQGQNGSGSNTAFGGMNVNITSNTAAAEVGQVQLQVSAAGSLVNALTLGGSGAYTLATPNVSAASTAAQGINITAGNASGTGSPSNGGSITLTPGTSTNGTAGSLLLANITASSAAQAGTYCGSASGASTSTVTIDTTLACLASDERLKNIAAFTPAAPFKTACEEEAALVPINYTWKSGTPKFNGDPGNHIGLGAFTTAYVDERLIGRDTEGNPRGWRQDAVIALGVACRQEQQKRLADLEKRAPR